MLDQHQQPGSAAWQEASSKLLHAVSLPSSPDAAPPGRRAAELLSTGAQDGWLAVSTGRSLWGGWIEAPDKLELSRYASARSCHSLQHCRTAWGPQLVSRGSINNYAPPA